MNFRVKPEDNRISLVACDLDGTLLGPGGTGVDSAREVVDLCKSLGVAFTIATGRAFGSVEKYLLHLGLDRPVISNGGAMIAALKGKPLMVRSIDPGVARAISEELRGLRLPFYYTVGKDMLTEWEGPETADYSANISFEIKVVASLNKPDLSPTQIVVRVPPGAADSLVSGFRDKWKGRACVIKSLPHLIELQAPGVSKASALSFMAKTLGVARSRVLAIGDGLNDLDMLAWAGHSACVGNADPEVKAAAGIVSRGFYAEGVAEIIRNAIGAGFC